MTEWRRLLLVPYRNYEVSDDGRVRRNGRELQGYVDRYGYRTVQLSYAGLSRRFKVCRLICEAFHGSPPGGAHAAHANGDSLDDRAENLSWKTPKENSADKRAHGTHQAGEKHPRARLTSEQVEAIRKSPLSSRAAATRFGVNQSQIVRIRNGSRWAEGIAK